MLCFRTSNTFLLPLNIRWYYVLYIWVTTYALKKKKKITQHTSHIYEQWDIIFWHSTVWWKLIWQNTYMCYDDNRKEFRLCFFSASFLHWWKFNGIGNDSDGAQMLYCTNFKNSKVNLLEVWFGREFLFIFLIVFNNNLKKCWSDAIHILSDTGSHVPTRTLQWQRRCFAVLLLSESPLQSCLRSALL